MLFAFLFTEDVMVLKILFKFFPKKKSKTIWFAADEHVFVNITFVKKIDL